MQLAGGNEEQANDLLQSYLQQRTEISSPQPRPNFAAQTKVAEHSFSHFY